MGFTVSALTDYVNQESETFLYSTITEGQTVGLIPNVQSGIKTAEKIKIISTTGVWQALTGCGFNASGATTFSDRTITVGKIKIQLSWCPFDLEAKYTQKKLAKGSKYEDLTFEKEIVAQLQNNDSVKVEQAVWNGDTDSVDAYLKRFDGFRKIIGAASGVLACSASSSTAWSEANSRTVSKSLASKIATSANYLLTSKDVVAFIGTAEYTDLKLKYIADNLYHITGNEDLKVEGTNIPYVPVDGLSGKKEIYVMEKSNMYLGVDLEGEEDKFSITYASEADEIRYDKRFKMGVQVAFPDRIVKYIQ
jgi:hypothetical protein